MADSIFLEASTCSCDASLDLWLRDALPHTPGIVRAAAQRELVLAAQEFYRRSFAWRVLVGPFHGKQGDYLYFQSPYDDYSNVAGILAVAWQGATIDPMSAPSALPTTSTSPTHWFVADGVDAFRLYPALTADVQNALHALVALAPKQEVEHLPRIAESTHYDAIMDGFLARVKAHPMKPYSDPQGATERRTRFLAAIARYSGQARQGYANAQAWSFPRFGR